MAKIQKNTLKAKQNRNRVNLHRAWKSIYISDQRNSSVNQHSNSNQQDNRTDIRGPHLQESLRRWALNFNISKRAVNDLLKILISFGMSSLPSDSRSLLSTPRSIKLKSLTNGKIW